MWGRSNSWAIAGALAAALVGCGGTAMSGIGTSHAPRDPEAIDLSLRTHDGRVLELADQQGSPVLLFFFATYDGASLAAARGVARFARDAPETVVVAVALQPDAATFTRAYVELQEPPYTVAYDPEDRVVEGISDLGAFEAIPMFVMIDARGHEVARHVGYASERMLQRFRRDALARGGVVPAEVEAEVDAAETDAGADAQTEAAPEAEPDLIIEPD